MENQPFGMANDNTQYSIESPEVIKYLELFPDVTEEAAIGSVVNIHNHLLEGDENIAGDLSEEIVNMIRAEIYSHPETEISEEEPEDDGLEKSNPESESDSENSEESQDESEEPEDDQSDNIDSSEDEGHDKQAPDNGGVADPSTVNEIKE